MSARRLQSTNTALAAAVALLAFAGCSASIDEEDADGPPMFGSNPRGNGTANDGALANLPGAAANNPLTPSGSNGGVNDPGGVTPSNNPSNGEQNAANGAPIDDSSDSNTSGNAAAAGAGGTSMAGNANGDGANAGAGGMSGTPPQEGLPPEETDPINPQETEPPVTEPPVTEPPVTEPPVTEPPVTEPPVTEPPVVPPPPTPPVFETDCPSDAFFCTGFENGFPEGTANILGGSPVANAFVLDTTERNSGAQSFHLPAGPNQAFLYRVLAVPVARQQFWVRMFFRSDVAFGSSNSHESIFAPSTGSLTQDNNNETRIELSEQFGYMLLNVKDALREPLVRTRLAANEWHCIEARYDGDVGEVEIFANGEPFIDDQAPLLQLDFQTFRLGYMKFNNTTRAVWFDDVVLATNRIGCD